MTIAYIEMKRETCIHILCKHKSGTFASLFVREHEVHYDVLDDETLRDIRKILTHRYWRWYVTYKYWIFFMKLFFFYVENIKSFPRVYEIYEKVNIFRIIQNMSSYFRKWCKDFLKISSDMVDRYFFWS